LSLARAEYSTGRDQAGRTDRRATLGDSDPVSLRGRLSVFAAGTGAFVFKVAGLRLVVAAAAAAGSAAVASTASPSYTPAAHRPAAF